MQSRSLGFIVSPRLQSFQRKNGVYVKREGKRYPLLPFAQGLLFTWGFLIMDYYFLKYFFRRKSEVNDDADGSAG